MVGLFTSSVFSCPLVHFHCLLDIKQGREKIFTLEISEKLHIHREKHMHLRKIQDQHYEGKHVLVRVDFNVTLRNEDIAERYKVESAKKTIAYLLEQQAKTVTLATHLGRPEGQYDEKCSLKHLLDDISRVLGYDAIFVPDISENKAWSAVKGAPEKSVLLLENVRFFVGEEGNDPDFSRSLANPFDIFVNDAFSVCHRDQASVTGVARLLPSVAGFRLQEEVENLEKIRTNPERPAIAVIGGAKIETKLPLLRAFESVCDSVLVGGKIANEAIDGRLEFSDKVLFPTDFLGGRDRFDIGPETIRRFCDVVAQAKTIIWNGPMGMFEDERYAGGTRDIVRAIVDSDAYTVTGGGESVQILEEMKLMDKFSFVSTGGGAMLDFLAGERMPGLEALEESQ